MHHRTYGGTSALDVEKPLDRASLSAQDSAAPKSKITTRMCGRFGTGKAANAAVPRDVPVAPGESHGTHRRRSHRRRGGMGNARRTLAKAIVPFGLWGAQRLMRRKKNRRTMKRMGKRVTSLL